MKKITALFLLSALAAFGQLLPPGKATQSEVDAGVNDSKFVTPKTLANKPGGGGGGVTSVNGQTGAVNVKPLTTFAALTSDAITLGHDGITRTDTISATKNLTLASAGSSGDERILDFTVTGGTQTVTTNFAVIRNLAGSASTVSRVFKDRAWIKMVNVNGTIHWFDNGFDAIDLPVGTTPVSFTPAADNVKAYFDAIDTAIAALAATITGIDSAPVGTGGLWTTSDIANRPLNWLVNDGTNGTPAAGTVGGMTAIIKGGGTVTTPAVSNGIVAGTYTGSQNVGVASATAGTSLYYTFGSSPTDPTTSDTLVSGTIPVTATGTLKVKGFKPLYNASSVFSAAYTINPAFTYLISDDLIHVNNAAAVTAGWSSVISGYWGYTTSPAPLAGFARSLRTFWGDGNTSKSFTAQGDVWAYFIMNCPSVTAGGMFFALGDGTNNLLKLSVSQSNLMSIGFGTTGGGSVDVAFVQGTTYHIWVHYVKGTSNNALIELFRSTDGTKGTSIAANSGAPGTTDASTVRLGIQTNGTVIFNKLRVSATSIGDNPL